jgi:hypothetical protein
MTDHDAKYYRKPWMTDDQWECARMWASIVGGFHHVVGEIKDAGRGIRVTAYASGFSTFDFDRLTALVFAAHDACIRVELAQSAPAKVAFYLHKRHAREGAMHLRHPTIETALTEWRKRNPASEESTTPDATPPDGAKGER